MRSLLSLASSANHVPIPQGILDADKVFSATRFVQMAQARNLERALRVARRTERLAREHLGPKHLEYAQALNNLGVLEASWFAHWMTYWMG